MALVSSKGIYGLSAIYMISMHCDEKPVQTKEISKSTNIPQNYLEQILVLLKRAEIISSTRGIHGGYSLSKKTEDITIKEVLTVLEGDLIFADIEISDPVLRLFCEESTAMINDIFSLTIKDLQDYNDRLGAQINYTI